MNTAKESKIMVLEKEILILVLAVAIQFCVVKSTSTIATKYELVSVEANSFISIRTTNLAIQG